MANVNPNVAVGVDSFLATNPNEGSQAVSDTPIMDAVDAKCDELNVMDAICYAVYEGQKLEIKLNETQQRIKQLEEAGDAMEKYIHDQTNTRFIICAIRWRETKEVK